MPDLKLTQKSIQEVEHPLAGQVFYWDTTLPGFGLRVTPGTKTFICQKRVNGRTVRTTIGRANQTSPQYARTLAQKYINRMIEGEDVNRSKRGFDSEQITLEAAWMEFKQTRDLRPSTLRDYEWCLNKVFDDWKKMPIREITRDMVLRRHKRTKEKIENSKKAKADDKKKRGVATANRASRFLRALLNFAAGRYEDRAGQPLIINNPVDILRQTKSWYRPERRRTIIKSHQLAIWYQAVEECSNETVRDFLLLILFTGLRKSEAQRIRWVDVDLKAQTFTIPDTKNRKPLDLPLSNFLFKLIQRRYTQVGDSPFVFPGRSASGHLSEPKKVVAGIAKNSGVTFCLHDLRRTYITTAESLDIPAYSLKALVNHSAGSDVTAGYIVMDAERLRKPMQKITDRLLALCKEKNGKIVTLPGVGE